MAQRWLPTSQAPAGLVVGPSETWSTHDGWKNAPTHLKRKSALSYFRSRIPTVAGPSVSEFISSLVKGLEVML